MEPPGARRLAGLGNPGIVVAARLAVRPILVFLPVGRVHHPGDVAGTAQHEFHRPAEQRRSVEDRAGGSSSEDRRVGKECVSRCKSRWWTCNEKKTDTKRIKH